MGELPDNNNQEPLIVFTALERAGINEIKKSLLEKGFEQEDVELSVQLADDISKIDSLVFSDGIPISYADSFSEHTAQYHPGSEEENQSELYIIYAKGMSGKIAKGKNIFQFNKNGKLILKNSEGEEGIEITSEELLFGVAAHEVRHRVQKSSDFKKLVSRELPMETDRREKDARMIEFMSMKALHAGKPIEEIAKIIKEKQEK